MPSAYQQLQKRPSSVLQASLASWNEARDLRAREQSGADLGGFGERNEGSEKASQQQQVIKGGREVLR